MKTKSKKSIFHISNEYENPYQATLKNTFTDNETLNKPENSSYYDTLNNKTSFNKKINTIRTKPLSLDFNSFKSVSVSNDKKNGSILNQFSKRQTILNTVENKKSLQIPVITFQKNRSTLVLDDERIKMIMSNEFINDTENCNCGNFLANRYLKNELLRIKKQNIKLEDLVSFLNKKVENYQNLMIKMTNENRELRNHEIVRNYNFNEYNGHLNISSNINNEKSHVDNFFNNTLVNHRNSKFNRITDDININIRSENNNSISNKHKNSLSSKRKSLHRSSFYMGTSNDKALETLVERSEKENSSKLKKSIDNLKRFSMLNLKTSKFNAKLENNINSKNNNPIIDIADENRNNEEIEGINFDLNVNNTYNSKRKGSLLSNLGIHTTVQIDNNEEIKNDNNENHSNNKIGKKPFMMYTKLINLAAKKNIDEINITSLSHLKKNLNKINNSNITSNLYVNSNNEVLNNIKKSNNSRLNENTYNNNNNNNINIDVNNKAIISSFDEIEKIKKLKENKDIKFKTNNIQLNTSNSTSIIIKDKNLNSSSPLKQNGQIANNSNIKNKSNPTSLLSIINSASINDNLDDKIFEKIGVKQTNAQINHYNKIKAMSLINSNKTNTNHMNSFLSMSEKHLTGFINNELVEELGEIIGPNFIPILAKFNKEQLAAFSDMIKQLIKDYQQSVSLITLIKKFLRITLMKSQSDNDMSFEEALESIRVQTNLILDCDRTSVFVYDKGSDMLILYGKKENLKYTSGTLGNDYLKEDVINQIGLEKIPNTYQSGGVYGRHAKNKTNTIINSKSFHSKISLNSSSEMDENMKFDKKSSSNDLKDLSKNFRKSNFNKQNTISESSNIGYSLKKKNSKSFDNYKIETMKTKTSFKSELLKKTKIVSKIEKPTTESIFNLIKCPVDKGIAGWVYTNGAKLNIEDAYQDYRFNKEVDKKIGYKTKTILCFPLVDEKKQIFGVIQAINKKNGKSFTKDDEELMEIFCFRTCQILKGCLKSEKQGEIITMYKYLVDFNQKSLFIKNKKDLKMLLIEFLKLCFNSRFVKIFYVEKEYNTSLRKINSNNDSDSDRNNHYKKINTMNSNNSSKDNSEIAEEMKDEVKTDLKKNQRKSVYEMIQLGPRKSNGFFSSFETFLKKINDKNFTEFEAKKRDYEKPQDNPHNYTYYLVDYNNYSQERMIAQNCKNSIVGKCFFEKMYVGYNSKEDTCLYNEKVDIETCNSIYTFPIFKKYSEKGINSNSENLIKDNNSEITLEDDEFENNCLSAVKNKNDHSSLYMIVQCEWREKLMEENLNISQNDQNVLEELVKSIFYISKIIDNK